MAPWTEEEAAGHGLLLLRLPAARAARWVRGGLVSAAVVGLPGWTGVCLADPRSRAVAPYDLGTEVLAARPVPAAGRPSVGLFVLDGCAVVTVQPAGRRASQRWVVWEPGSGVRSTPDLAPLPSALLVDVAGAGSRTDAESVRGHLRDGSGTPLDLLVGLQRLLGLPGEALLREGPDPEAEVVEPGARGVRRFNRLITDEAAHRLEQEQGR
ncbi:MAG TPA: hypothetical protein VES95_12005 [Dermatophilaceae bacterium]|nr:hypothetical protein [Dermatophilaceae bacterium]